MNEFLANHQSGFMYDYATTLKLRVDLKQLTPSAHIVISNRISQEFPLDVIFIKQLDSGQNSFNKCLFL